MALLPVEQREEKLAEWAKGAGLTVDVLLARIAKSWEWLGRPKQQPPVGDWRVWYLQGGRGSGKSRAGAETLAKWVRTYPAGEWAVVAPTYADARDVCVEARGALLDSLGGYADAGGLVVSWNRSTGKLTTTNGSEIFLDGADDGALRIQGHNLSGAWCDEVGLWKDWRRAWEESLAFAIRVDPGRIVATGTPKAGHGLIRQLLDDPATSVSRMRTMDNAANLHKAALQDLVRRYAGTTLGRQELEAEFIEEVEGALWTHDQLDLRRRPAPEDLARIVVGVDPNTSPSEAANNAGIIVAGREQGQALKRRAWVMDDCTITSGGPRAWAKAAVDAYHAYSADRIVAEKNQGGQMVEITIHTVDPTVPVKLVPATKGKRTRAEPIAALYESSDANPLGQVFHIRPFPELEEEMTTWTPEAESPDRMDALVWALTELMLGATGTMRTAVAQGRVPSPIGR